MFRFDEVSFVNLLLYGLHFDVISPKTTKYSPNFQCIHPMSADSMSVIHFLKNALFSYMRERAHLLSAGSFSK